MAMVEALADGPDRRRRLVPHPAGRGGEAPARSRRRRAAPSASRRCCRRRCSSTTPATSTLPALWRALALNPARLLGLAAGRLAPGAPADLVLFDPDTPFVLDRATLRSKSKNTPYDLRRMQGRVLAHLGRRARRSSRGRPHDPRPRPPSSPTSLGSIPFGVLITRALGLGDLRAHRLGQHRRHQRAPHRQQGAPPPRRCSSTAARARVAVLVARALAGETGGDGRGLRRLPRPPLPGLAEVPRRQGRRHLPRRHAGARLAGRPRRLRHLARDRLRLPLLSLAALVAAATTPLWLALFGRPDAVWLGVALAALVFVRHHANIRRLLAGTEPRIGTGR